MIITDTLNGHTVEDVRRNSDGSVSLYCSSGRTLTLCVEDGEIGVSPVKAAIPDIPLELVQSKRMRLLEAFQGHMIHYAYHNERGYLTFVCEPLRHDTEAYHKSIGHREITLSHSTGLIDELPPVSAVITLPSLSMSGKMGL